MTQDLEAVLRRTIERERKARAHAESLLEERMEAVRVAYLSQQSQDERRMVLTLGLLPCPIAIVRADGTIVLANSAAVRMLNLTDVDEMVNTHWSRWTLDHTFDALPAVAPPGTETVLQLRTHNAKAVVVGLVMGRVQYQGREDRIFVMRDLSEQRRHEEALQYQATHDPLTGLPNRILFMDRAAQAIERVRRKSGLMCLMFVDLDKFKLINDTLGHAAGDEVLREISHRLRHVVRKVDTVARLGGDEFVLACELPDDGYLALLSQRVMAVLDQPIVLGDGSYRLGGSVGVACYPQHGEEVEQLLKRADIAMYHAKSQGGSQCCSFEPAMQDAIDQSNSMETRLRQGLTKKELVLHFQPQVDCASGAVVAVEALVRWNSPDYGFLPPGKFLPLAEECKLIHQIDHYVLDAACAQIAYWHSRGYGWVRVAVNMSATHFSNLLFFEDVARCINKHQVPPSALVLEVTESLSMTDPLVALQIMSRMKSLGMMLAIDDFGTGYSNLGYLKHLPADHLKIDQSFVRGLLTGKRDQAIVALIVQLAHDLGMRTIAEGVETQEQAARLIAMGADELQGYWIARPQEASVVERMFNTILPMPQADPVQR